MRDLISRQAAIDALDEQIEQCNKSLSSFDISMKDEYAVKVERASLVAFREILEYLPSAQLGTNLAEVGTDCISRQAAIDIAKELTITVDGYEMLNQAVMNYCAEITQLPPAQPEPHWIPVTEDTPTEDDDYWATFEAETGRFVDWASWYQGRWVVWIEGSPAPLSNVIAWQKCPEPYKGVTT